MNNLSALMSDLKKIGAAQLDEACSSRDGFHVSHLPQQYGDRGNEDCALQILSKESANSAFFVEETRSKHVTRDCAEALLCSV